MHMPHIIHTPTRVAHIGSCSSVPQLHDVHTPAPHSGTAPQDSPAVFEDAHEQFGSDSVLVQSPALAGDSRGVVTGSEDKGWAIVLGSMVESQAGGSGLGVLSGSGGGGGRTFAHPCRPSHLSQASQCLPHSLTLLS